MHSVIIRTIKCIQKHTILTHKDNSLKKYNNKQPTSDKNLVHQNESKALTSLKCKNIILIFLTLALYISSGRSHLQYCLFVSFKCFASRLLYKPDAEMLSFSLCMHSFFFCAQAHIIQTDHEIKSLKLKWILFKKKDKVYSIWWM